MHSACLLLSSLLCSVTAWDIAKTPPMAYNSWTNLNSRVSAAGLQAVAQAIHDTGLLAAGYEYVNSDDEWMERDRDAQGNQVANSTRFPGGWPPVAAFIHGLGMKVGLYTSKSQYTCAGFNASCMKETIDAASYASWGIDFVKEDSCGSCRNNDTLDYETMFAAITAAGRPMILTTEGNPDNAYCSQFGGCGNAKRIGHDIGSEWNNVLSLIDISSGLWPFAHNATNPATISGGWWNDMDMMQLGNWGPFEDFNCSAGTAGLSRCQAHFSMWCLQKSPLIIGSNPTTLDAAALGVLMNTEAISINQDALGIQARRVAVQQPANASLTGLNSGWDNIAVAGRCNASNPTQSWVFTNKTQPGPPVPLYQVPCNAGDASQNWTFAADGTIRAGGSSAPLCVIASTGGCLAALQVTACDPTDPAQQWTRPAGGQITSVSTGQCWDIPYGSGPQVAMCGCHPAGTASNQEWTQDAPGDALVSLAITDSCVGLSAGAAGGTLSTVDGAGNQWCLRNVGGCEGMWSGVSCQESGDATLFTPMRVGPPPGGSGPSNYSLVQAGGLTGPGWNNQPGASGPWPHTRYVTGNGGMWTLDLSLPSTPVLASDSLGIIDDDLVGGVSLGGEFCLDLVTGGMLEVWATPLLGGAWGVGLFNRSPGNDTITVSWGMLPAGSPIPPTASFDVRDVWAAADRGSFTGQYTTSVASRSVALLILKPTSTI